jgi:protein O-mannosyl-transferase
VPDFAISPGVDPAAPKTAAWYPRWSTVAVALVLGALVLGLYYPVAGYPFVNFDDDAHVFLNPRVTTGFSTRNLAWAFGIHGPSQWHPLAWISHQADCDLWGANLRDGSAGGHHLTNLVWHGLNVWLVYVVIFTLLRVANRTKPSDAVEPENGRKTSATRASGQNGEGRVRFWACWAAAVFAIHPLNIETVAWISERRNVLCLAFLLMGVLAHLRYGLAPTVRGYLVTVCLFVLALLCKPLAVTFPCLLWLLDGWPLRRFFKGENERRLVVIEKLPLLLLSAVASWLTILCQQAGGAIERIAAATGPVRLANALTAYGRYLRRLVWPDDLCVFYPHPAVVFEDPLTPLGLSAVVSLAVLAGLTFAAVRRKGTAPGLLVGWLWFLGTMVPSLGLVQSGEQQMADRYMYLPMIGCLVGVVVVLMSVERRALPSLRWTLRATAWLAVAGLAVVAAGQLRTWRDSVALFERALAVTDRNSWAHLNLGQALVEQGDPVRAQAEFQAAIALQPGYALAYYNLGVLAADAGRVKEAVELWTLATGADAGLADAWVRLGAVRGSQGEFAKAASAFERALRAEPGNVHALYNLGQIWERMGRQAEARAVYEAALVEDPAFAPARERLDRGR